MPTLIIIADRFENGELTGLLHQLRAKGVSVAAADVVIIRPSR